MTPITKKMFLQMHASGDLRLIVGGIKLTKEEVMAKLETVRHNIEDYVRLVTNYGSISDKKNGSYVVKVWRSSCEDFIFVEETVDYSKDPNTLQTEKHVYTTAYLTN